MKRVEIIIGLGMNVNFDSSYETPFVTERTEHDKATMTQRRVLDLIICYCFIEILEYACPVARD